MKVKEKRQAQILKLISAVEVDHLNGKTLFESADPMARIEALRAYDEARKAGARPGDTDFEVR